MGENGDGFSDVTLKSIPSMEFALQYECRDRPGWGLVEIPLQIQSTIQYKARLRGDLGRAGVLIAMASLVSSVITYPVGIETQGRSCLIDRKSVV